MVRPEGLLANDIAMEDHCLVGGLAHLLHLFPCQRSRNGVRLLDQASQKEIAFLPNDDASLFEPIVEEQSNPSHLRLVVIVDSEAREQELILVGTQTTIQNLFRLRCRLASLQNEGPERRVIEIVDVCIGLSPRNVIANVLEWKITQFPTW